MKVFTFFPGLLSFFKEVQLEIGKVNWPTRNRTMRDTTIVIVFSVVVALFLAGFDYIFGEILQLLIAL